MGILVIVQNIDKQIVKVEYTFLFVNHTIAQNEKVYILKK